MNMTELKRVSKWQFAANDYWLYTNQKYRGMSVVMQLLIIEQNLDINRLFQRKVTHTTRIDLWDVDYYYTKKGKATFEIVRELGISKKPFLCKIFQELLQVKR